MAKFTLQSTPEIYGKIKFYYLEVDGINQYREFELQIEQEGTYVSELRTIQTRMIEVANLQRLPKTKFRLISNDKDLVKKYEIKTNNLRVYLFHEELKGHIVVCGGKKNSQPKDIRKFNSLVKQYLNAKT